MRGSLIPNNQIDLGFDMIEAVNVQDAVNKAIDCRPDLILMDVKMPVLDGHKAAKMIKSISSETPVIAQSAYALEHEIEEFNE